MGGDDIRYLKQLELSFECYYSQHYMESNDYHYLYHHIHYYYSLLCTIIIYYFYYNLLLILKSLFPPVLLLPLSLFPCSNNKILLCANSQILLFPHLSLLSFQFSLCMSLSIFPCPLHFPFIPRSTPLPSLTLSLYLKKKQIKADRYKHLVSHHVLS